MCHEIIAQYANDGCDPHDADIQLGDDYVLADDALAVLRYIAPELTVERQVH